MIIYQDNNFIIETRYTRTLLLTDSVSMFCSEDNKIQQDSVYMTVNKFDEEGKLLPSSQWKLEVPFNPIIQIYPDGHKTKWVFEGGQIHFYGDID